MLAKMPARKLSCTIVFLALLLTLVTGISFAQHQSSYSQMLPGPAGGSTIEASPGLSFPIPDTQPLTHSQNPAGTLAGSLNFSPGSGHFGDTISVSPSLSMTPNSSVTMRFFSGDTTGINVPFIVPCSTDGNGFFNCSFKVPALFFGSHGVTVTDGSNQQSSGFFSILAGISLSPAIGPAGTRVTINGGGWALNDTIIVKFDNTLATQIGCPTTNGGFTCQFDVPANAANGSHTFLAHGHVPSTDVTATFQVAPGASLTLAPTAGQAGTIAKVSGAGLQPSTTLSLEFNHAPISFGAACTTNSTGSFANCSYIVPALPPGTDAVSVFDGVSNPTANYTILPSGSITVTPDPIGPDSNLTINGINFGAGKSLTFQLDGVSVNPVNGSTFTDSNGNIPPFTFIYLGKLTTLGQHTVSVTDGNSLATADFTVVTVVALNPNSGHGGNTVTITGNGFGANQSVTGVFGGAPINFVSPCSTDANNSFSCSVIVPPTPAGQLTFLASDPTHSANDTFTIAPAASLANSSTVVGAANTLSGDGFGANKNITATVGGVSISFTSACTTDANGSFSCAFNVPAVAFGNGQQTVQVNDAGGNTDSINFAVIPALALSSYAGIVGTPVTLTGTGLLSSRSIHVGFGPSGVSTNCNTDAKGSLSCGFTVPERANGPQNVSITDTQINTVFTPTPFNVLPSITLLSNSGIVGSNNKLNGTGFGASKNLTAKLGATAISFNPATCTTNGSGTFSCAFSVPSVPFGQLMMQATDTASNSANTMLLVHSPTAAPANISGRITSIDGRPLGGVTVYLTGGKADRTITDSHGQYHFDDVATDGFYSVTPALVNYSFGPVALSFSLLANKSDAVFTATPTTETDNPLNGADFFVRQQYLDFLGREPDHEGWLFWTDQINRCGDDAVCERQRRLDVAASFFMATEFQQSGSFIYDLYAGALGRRPSFAEYSTDRQQVVGGATLDEAKGTFAQSFVQRAEFTVKYQNATTAESFVDELMLSRQSSGVDLGAERANLIETYDAGADLVTSRAAVVQSIADNAAFKQAQYNQAFVLTEYFGFLLRDPDQAGYNFWVNVLSNAEPGNYRGMVCSFITSTEYQRRFANVVTRSNVECGQ